MLDVGQSSVAAKHSGWGRIGSGLNIRPLRPTDLDQLMPVVGILVDSLYPKGATKLLARLEDALNGYATAHVTDLSGIGPIALAAETTKGCNRVKLSTFWVDPRFRGIGIGSSLLDHRIENWLHCDINATVVTVREERAPEFEGLFGSRGFTRVATDLNKYGEGQNEVVLRWTNGAPLVHSRSRALYVQRTA